MNKKGIVLLGLIVFTIFAIFYQLQFTGFFIVNAETGNVLLDPEARNLTIDFDQLFSLGNATNVEVVDGSLVLAKKDNSNYYLQGEFLTPVFDTQNEYVMWDWVYADVDFKGMQENLLDDGDFETLNCTQWFDGSLVPIPCGYYFKSTVKYPFIDSNVSSTGNNSIRFGEDPSNKYNNAYFSRGTDYWINVTPDKPIHTLFDLKYDTKGAHLEYWITLSNGTSTKYHGAVTRYTQPIDDFEEQYFTFNSDQIVDDQEITKMKYLFFKYYQNEHYNTTAWIDNVRIFQDSPIHYKVRTSANGINWTNWNDPRYFVAEKTAPGGQVDRYIQFNIVLETNDISKTPELRVMKMDYSKAFPFKIDWDSKGPTIFDEPIADIDSKGFIRSNSEGNFEYENGEGIKFWALQLSDEIHTKLNQTDMDSMCKRLREMGFNMMKVTHSSLPSFRMMVNECKEEGIYIYTQLGGVSYPALTDKEASAIEMFDKMNVVNEYNGISFKDDPQFLLLQMLNEVSFHSIWRNGGTGYMSYGDVMYSGIYDVFFNDSWDSWIEDKYPTYGELVLAWDDSTGDAFYGDESSLNYPENIRRTLFADIITLSEQRFMDTTEFYADIHEDFYQYVDNFMKDNEVQGLMVPNNHYYGLAELEARLVTDVIDQHSYFPHIKVTQYSEIGQQLPQVKTPYDNLVTYIALDAIEGKPLTVSESNHNFPNLYSMEMPLFTSAYMAFQDWDQWTYFKVHTLDPTDESKEQVPEAFDSWFDSGSMALMPAASRIFTKDYISPARTVIQLEHSQNITNNHQKDQRYKKLNVPDMNLDLVMQHRIERASFNATIDKTKEEYYLEYNLTGVEGIYLSDTEELYLDSDKGYLLINSAKAQGFTGFTQSETLNLLDININIPSKGNNFSSIILVPLDDKEIRNSTHLFLTAVGRTESSSVKWRADKKGYEDEYCHSCLPHYGKEPVLVEGITATINLNSLNDNLTIYKINSDAQRTNETINYALTEEGFEFVISDMDETLWYELVLDEVIIEIEEINETNNTVITPPGDGNGGDDSEEDNEIEDGGTYDDPASYCGDLTCDIDEYCETCPTDCGTCPANLWEEGPFEINVSENDSYAEIVSAGGNYSLTIGSNSQPIVIQNIDSKLILLALNNKVYEIPFENTIEIYVDGNRLLVSYLANQENLVRLKFQNKGVWTFEKAILKFNIIIGLLIGSIFLIIFIILLILKTKGTKNFKL